VDQKPQIGQFLVGFVVIYLDGGTSFCDNFLDDPPGLDDATVDEDDFDDLEEDTMFGKSMDDDLDGLDGLDEDEIDAEFEENPSPKRSPKSSTPKRRRREQATPEATTPATPRRRRRK